jgi:hypothetical protein
VVNLGVMFRGPDTLPDVPRDVPLGGASVEASGNEAVQVALAVDLSVPLGLSDSRGWAVKCAPAVLLIATSFSSPVS